MQRLHINSRTPWMLGVIPALSQKASSGSSFSGSGCGRLATRLKSARVTRISDLPDFYPNAYCCSRTMLS